MQEHGTALTTGQRAEFVGKATRNILLVVDRLTPQLLGAWDGKDAVMQERFLQIFTEPIEQDLQAPEGKPREPVIATYPAVGEVFELTLDGDAPENQPLEMVRRDGYTGDWRHKGPVVKGVETRRFKFVSVGYCANWNELKQKLAEHGEIAPGQWREAFKKKYPTPDGNGPIGFPDASWAGPDGNAFFPCVDADGESDFDWTGDGWVGNWRWLVGVRK